MSPSNFSESQVVLLYAIIIFMHEKPLSMTASDCGTNKYSNNSLLIFGKAVLTTEAPRKSATVSGDCFFCWITCNSLSLLFVICVFCRLLKYDET